jgi:3-dehydroquinate synthase
MPRFPARRRALVFDTGKIVRTIPLQLAGRACPIRVHTQAAALIAPWIRAAGERCVFVTDANVRRRVWPGLRLALRARRCALPEPIVVPAGEASKSVRTWHGLHRQLLARGADRGSVVVAVGGGVVTDLAGFAAATYMRGIDWLAVPTTLLGMVDAAIGGKVGLDAHRRKNLVGAFHQPRAVLAGTDLLQTLPPRQRLAGLAEVVKYAMIADRALFFELRRGAKRWRAAAPRRDAALVARCAGIKARIVAADERERGDRAQLNFGHTIGHALEACSRLTHGEAVGLGMLAACWLAEDAQVAEEPLMAPLAALLAALGLPLRAPRGVGRACVLAALRADKKAERGQPRFVLTPRIGRARVRQPIAAGPIGTAIDRILRG